jgi:GH25 family lysozyme M1 (1,4-beta-N-acetylmuramidase)
LGRRPRNRPVACAVSHTGGKTTTTTSRRRSTAPATVLATVVLILVFAAPASASGEPGEAGASGATGATVAVVPTIPMVPAGALPGIDVSNHQGAIDWSLVAASGTRFAFAKATEGRTFIDPMYATNKAGAALGGVVFGAYHFARPDDTANDAVIEADHFVDVAQLAPGNLLPVLDIESTGGLTQAQVTQWILAWLDRVTVRLGVRPIVYTSPNGWENRTGDTTAVVDAGYSVLWVAHWGVASPTVPAANWGGNGWTFWQYGNCGAIPGIDGCVDVDWYETASFDPVTIPVPDDVPPSATIALPATPGEPISITFSEIVHRVTPENVFVWIPSTGTYPDVELSCRSGKGRPVDCVAGNVRSARVRPLGPSVLGETYEAVVNPAIAPVLVVDRSANPVPTTALGFATPTEVEEDSPAISYAWRTASKARAKGGRYAVEHRAGATASFAFAGGSVTWYTAVGPDGGKAAVSIDDVRRGTFDAYAARADFGVPRTFDGLGPGSHTITVRVLGRARASATDTQVVVDAFRAGGKLVSNPDLRATWGPVERGGASGGSLGSSDLARSSAEVRFRGTGIEWFTYRGTDQGRAGVFVDGLQVRTFDNFAPTPTFGVARSITGLPEGVHTLRIVVLATARPAATGALVSIDRFSVVP